MKRFQHPLMSNNFTPKDFKPVIKYLNKKNVILTQSKKVYEFERKWSNWLGVKYSVFVNSGSSANLISIDILRILKGIGKVLVPSLTWSSDISSLIKNNMSPVFVDINLENLSMSEKKIFQNYDKNLKAIFLTHAQGFNGLSDDLLKFIKKKKIFLIEDVCESHGATFKGKKLGTFGEISNFSFYYAHHMSTIEGGMICTNNKKIYELARMLRSHGLVREIENKKIRNDIIKKNKFLSNQFIFLHPAYNMRNNEIGAILGISQLKKLNINNKKRIRNFNVFLKNLNAESYFTDFNLKGSSNYAFPLILKKKSIRNRNLLEKTMYKNGIEFRRGNAGGGNQLRQPYVKKNCKNFKLKNFKNVEHVHFYGYYIGNFPDLKLSTIFKTCKILNSIKFQ